jgi:hypothetical protein
VVSKMIVSPAHSGPGGWLCKLQFALSLDCSLPRCFFMLVRPMLRNIHGVRKQEKVGQTAVLSAKSNAGCPAVGAREISFINRHPKRRDQTASHVGADEWPRLLLADSCKDEQVRSWSFYLILRLRTF